MIAHAKWSCRVCFFPSSVVLSEIFCLFGFFGRR